MNTQGATIPARAEFYTWREAVLQAADRASRSSSKPRVRWSGDRWVVTYSYLPFATNGAAA